MNETGFVRLHGVELFVLEAPQRRRRAGCAEIVQVAERAVDRGDVLAMPSAAIHCVQNDRDRSAVSLLIWGKHVNHTARFRFDPLTGIEAPYQVATVEADTSTAFESGAAE